MRRRALGVETGKSPSFSRAMVLVLTRPNHPNKLIGWLLQRRGSRSVLSTHSTPPAPTRFLTQRLLPSKSPATRTKEVAQHAGIELTLTCHLCAQPSINLSCMFVGIANHKRAVRAGGGGKYSVLSRVHHISDLCTLPYVRTRDSTSLFKKLIPT